MRKQYHFKKSENGYFAWDVAKLVEQSKEFPVVEVALSKIRELDEPYWYAEASDVPSCRSIADHVKLISECDLDYPIILAADGSVMDGMHRVCKAYISNAKHIKAVKFGVTPTPDFEDILPHELSY